MAEIEYFVEPDKKEISKFPSVEDTMCRLYSRETQMAGEPAVMMSLKDAHQKVCYPICYSFLFLFVNKLGYKDDYFNFFFNF